MDRQQEQLAHILYRAVRDSASEPLMDGRAECALKEVAGDPLITLKPRNPNAAALDISIDTEHQVTCLPGNNGMTHEVFSKESAEISDNVQKLVFALVNGDYAEYVNTSGRRTKIVAQWMEEGQKVTSRLNVLRTPSIEGRGWRLVRYSSY